MTDHGHYVHIISNKNIQRMVNVYAVEPFTSTRVFVLVRYDITVFQVSSNSSKANNSL
jgi:hypothetical protein